MPDKYDRVILDIQRKTEDGSIRWLTAPAGRHAAILLNADRVVRSFSGCYPMGEKVYDLLFVERRIESLREYSGFIQALELELLILDEDHQIVLTLYSGLVDRSDLSQLMKLINSHNDLLQEFFEAFEESAAT